MLKKEEKQSADTNSSALLRLRPKNENAAAGKYDV
jgi:hypothetical protein